MSRHQLDVAALYGTLDAVRLFADKTWRDMAEITGLSPSTFSRLAAGRRPDADALCTLIAFLNVPLARFTIEIPREEP